MKVNICNGGITIEPETDFEQNYIIQNFDKQDIKCFVKFGLSSNDLIGIKICSSSTIKKDKE